MLELKGISKTLGALRIQDVSLRLGPGEYFVLLGPSGVGKTVLLEIIAGLRRPTGGRILWDGEDLTDSPPEARRFAVVYQDYALFPHLTVERNIGYGLVASGMARREVGRRVREVAGMLGIESLLKRLPQRLSGGEQQRVALGRALAIRPRMLLLDEPLSAVDTTARLDLRKELKRINAQSKTPALHVTHDPEEAIALGHRVGVMLGHRLRQVATPEELFRRPSDAQVAEFLGIWNVMPVDSVDGGSIRVRGQTIHVAAGKELISHIWIKPEEMLLSRSPFESSARNQFCGDVLEWGHRALLVAVTVRVGKLDMTAVITHASFKELQIERAGRVYVTFKSSAVGCL